MNEQEPELKPENNNISILDVIQAEITDLMKLSQNYRERISSAKTSVKKNLYEKKLKKNNIKLMDMLMAADKILKRRERENGTNPDQ